MCIQCGDPSHIGDATDGSISSAAPATHLDPIAAGAQITRHGYHWGSALGSATGPITFGFRSSAPTYNSTSNERSTFSAFSAQEVAAAEYAMQMWAHLANISFSEVNPGGYTNSATILFGNYFSNTDNAQAFAYFPSSNNQNFSSAQGDVWLNIKYEHTTNLFAGSYDLNTILHEVGHALGLEHPGSYNAGPGQTITYGNSAQYIEDSRQYTVMSYFSASNTGANHVYNGQTIYASTPLLDDIAAIQGLYGANTSYAIGNTTYGFHSNADTAFQLASATQQVVFTIWDGGGNDTVDFSGYSTNQVIDLVPGTFSSVGALTLNVSIALGAIIENAIGGPGNDVIYGNSANNTIDGGSGTDTFVLTGTHLQYQATLNPNGSLTLVDTRSGAPDGTDTVTNIESFQFSDGTYTSDQLAHSQSVNNTNLFNFFYMYTDGTRYHGIVADDGSLGYHVGQQISGANGGYYYIYGNAGPTTQAAGTVTETGYIDSSNQVHAPIYASNTGQSLGVGLGNDHDYVYDANHNPHAFGSGGAYEYIV
jgi:serralysin